MVSQIFNPIEVQIIKIFALCASSLLIAFLWAPCLIKFLYRYQLWRKSARTKTIDGKPAPVFYGLHKEREVSVPRLGGVLIWVTVILVAFFFAWLNKLFPGHFWFQKLDFLSRDQTWLPLITLLAASLLGLGDDVLQIFGKGGYKAGGLSFTRRLIVVFLIGLIGALWFYSKLEFQTLHVPFVGDVAIGFLYIPLFILTVLACWSGGVIDGIDGLAGGVFGIIFMAFGIISLAGAQYNLAAFCMVLAGAIMAFLWYNIPPAKFYMGETGMIGLTATLAVVAFLSNSVLVLPIIGGLLVVEAGSVIIQLLAKKILKRKIFLCAPFHHHLEAKGWLPQQITMRFWLINIVLAIVGIAIRLMG
jgi:phospho-N-acetylmuramoyl-pentapeptide-transferase